MARRARRVNRRRATDVAAGSKVCHASTVSELLERWLDRLETSGALIDGRPATRARLEAWFPWLQAAATGDESARAELMRLVALDARNLAQEGRPASTVVAQPLLLAGAWSAPAADELCQLLVRVAADAHALGIAGVHEAAQQRLLAKHAPVVALGDRWLGYLIGPMAADVIDGLFGRLMTGAAGMGATDIAVDVSGAQGPTPLFYRTLKGFSDTDTGSVRRLTVTGLAHTAIFERELEAMSIPSTRVTTGSLSTWLADRNVNDS